MKIIPYNLKEHKTKINQHCQENNDISTLKHVSKEKGQRGKNADCENSFYFLVFKTEVLHVCFSVRVLETSQQFLKKMTLQNSSRREASPSVDRGKKALTSL